MTIQGHNIQWDKSGGQGHCWIDADDDTCLPSTREEIAAEIIDGKRESGEYVATNGEHYRW